jgi:hypothetical protein
MRQKESLQMGPFSGGAPAFPTEAAGIDIAKRIIANSLPAVMASALQPEQLELMRLRLLQIPEPALPQLRKSDWL